MNFINHLINHFRISSAFKKYHPYIPVELEQPPYILKTANTRAEIVSLMELRRRSFFPDKWFHCDVTPYDAQADHLIVKQGESVVGNYRVTDGDHRTLFTSAAFDSREFLEKNYKKIELSRACTALGHQDGTALMLLWRGILKYAEQLRARYLFGMASVFVASKYDASRKAAAVYNYFDAANLLTTYRVKPREEREVPYLTRYLRVVPPSRADIPPLLKTYLRLGAKIGGYPAWDKNLKSVDFFCIIDLETVNPRIIRRFMGR